MENERIAKFFLSTILEQQIVSIDVRPQEFTYKDSIPDRSTEDTGYSVFRIDFMATVKTGSGEHKKILIEVQKSYEEDDLMRFRNYLGEQYKKMDTVDGVELILPITTIYVINFNLKGIKSACIKVDRNYIDMIGKKPVEARAAFIEKLTHNSYVIQAGRISDDRYATKLDKLLSLFEQNHFIIGKIGKTYPHPQDDEDIHLITSVLHEMMANPEERAKIEKEEEVLRIMKARYGKKNKVIEKQAKTIEEQERTIKDKDKTIEERDKTIEEMFRQIAELKRLFNK
jgi:hypothetical protein